MKAQQVKQPTRSSVSPCLDPFLAGATHYYQYDLAIGSTPPNYVDVFSPGAAGSNTPVTHAVFLIETVLDLVSENHDIRLLDLDEPTLKVHSSVLVSLPRGFNKPFYQIKVVTINCTCTEAPPLDKFDTCL